jgi:hypothetical protein
MMNKFCGYIKNYLVYGAIPVIGLIAWSILLRHDIAQSNVAVRALHEVLSYNLMLWFVVFMGFMVSLIVIPSVRENTLRYLANLKERDEREEYITAKAARSAYIATLSLTLFFLFFSLFSFHYSTLTKVTPDQPGHSVTVSFGYKVFAESATTLPAVQGASPVFDSTSYALSGSTLLILLLAWQLLIFNLSARRLSK